MVDGAGIVRRVVDTADDMDAMRQRPILAEATPDREQDAGPEQQEQDRVVPKD